MAECGGDLVKGIMSGGNCIVVACIVAVQGGGGWMTAGILFE